MQRLDRRRLSRVAMATAAIAALTLAGGALPAQAGAQKDKPTAQPALEARAKALITEGGKSFKDLNANGALDPYEDWRLPVPERAADLVGQMTLAEKAGLMLIDTMNATCDPVTGARGVVPTAGAALLQSQNMRRFIFRSVVAKESAAACSAPTPAEAATFTTSVQELAEQSRLGIPALFKSNARNIGLAKQWLERPDRSTRSEWLAILMIVAILVGMIAFVVWAILGALL